MTAPSPRVLVAEDDAAIRRLLASTLRRRHLDVQLAADGTAAQELLERERWDVVVLDMMMPGVTGWELVAWLQKHPDRRPRSIIVMSAAGRDALSSLDPTIVNAIFFKPFDVVQLGAYVSGAARHGEPDRRRGRRV
jgi:CheY-like chemotaxis protein